MNPIESWLSLFEKAVREVSYDTGFTLYNANPTLFGTRVVVSGNLEEYCSNQWRGIWEKSHDFSFTEVLAAQASGEMGYAVVLWSNITDINGQEVFREGRATFIFAIKGNQANCVHSHFSEFPRKT